MRSSSLFFPVVISTLITGVGFYFISQHFIPGDEGGDRSQVDVSPPIQAGNESATVRLVTPESSQSSSSSSVLAEPGFAPGSSVRNRGRLAYKWLDENGQAHYGDRPDIGASQVEVDAVYMQPNLSVVPTPAISAPHSVQDRSQRSRVITNNRSSDNRGRDFAANRQARHNEALCAQAEQQLDWIKSRMRLGYKAREADRLHRLELDARENRRKYCQGF